MNQVRAQLIQSLAARGIDISTVPPEQLIALSGEVGVAAFNDVYEKKTQMQARIREAKDKALTQLRELRGKRALNEDEYNRAVTELNVAESTKNRELNTAFNNAFLGLAEKRIGAQDTAQTQALNILNTAGIDPSKLGSLLDVVRGATSASEANRLVYNWLATPEGQTELKKAAELRGANDAAENAIKMQSLALEHAYKNATLENDRIKIGVQLKEAYMAEAKKWEEEGIKDPKNKPYYDEKAKEAFAKASSINI